MKRSAFFLIVCFLMIANNMFAQQTTYSAVTDSTGLPGDNFSLQGALEMFKQSKTPEDFEKKLNTKDNYVNNLDLNQDGKIDYIRVIDKTKGDAHALVLRVAVNKSESQDVAVIEIEKNGNQSAILQIVGDKELYGDSTYLEPVEAGAEKTKGTGPSGSISSISLFFVNVWFWPCVTYIYEPVYQVYESPWYWNYYPYWWSPWYPMPWYTHHHYCHDYYYSGYRPVYVHHVTYAHNVYYGHRSYSPTVVNHYQDAHIQYQANRTSKVQKANYNNNTQGKLDNNVQEKPVNGNQGKLNNNPESKPTNNNQGKINTYENKPSGNMPGKTNSYDTKPGYKQPGKITSFDNKTPSKYQSKPGNISSGKVNIYENKPGNVTPGNHNNNYQSKPGNASQGKPNNNIQSKPDNSNQSHPSSGQKVEQGKSGKSGNTTTTKPQNSHTTPSTKGGGHSKTNSSGNSK